jgi:hypothetical protein
MSQEVSVLHDTRAPVADDGAFKRTLRSNTRGHQYLKSVDGRLTADGVPEPEGKEYFVAKMEQTGRMFHKDGGPPETCPPELVDEMNSPHLPRWSARRQLIHTFELHRGNENRRRKTSLASAQHAQNSRRECLSDRHYRKCVDENSVRLEGKTELQCRSMGWGRS